MKRLSLIFIATGKFKRFSFLSTIAPVSGQNRRARKNPALPGPDWDSSPGPTLIPMPLWSEDQLHTASKPVNFDLPFKLFICQHYQEPFSRWGKGAGWSEDIWPEAMKIYTSNGQITVACDVNKLFARWSCNSLLFFLIFFCSRTFSSSVSDISDNTHAWQQHCGDTLSGARGQQSHCGVTARAH